MRATASARAAGQSRASKCARARRVICAKRAW